MSRDGLNGLLKTTDCKAWIYAEDDERGSLIEPGSGMPVCALPTLHWMLDSESQLHYPYNKTFDEAAWDDILIIHTSGTTGKFMHNRARVGRVKGRRLTTLQEILGQYIIRMVCGLSLQTTGSPVAGTGHVERIMTAGMENLRSTVVHHSGLPESSSR